MSLGQYGHKFHQDALWLSCPNVWGAFFSSPIFNLLFKVFLGNIITGLYLDKIYFIPSFTT